MVRCSSSQGFVNYFYDSNIVRYKGWHAGRFVGAPSTNNGLEATNNVIKTHYTFHERLPMGPFLDLLKSMIHDWSVERSDKAVNTKIFATEPIVDLKLMTEAYNWRRGKPTVRVSKNIYFIAPGSGVQMKAADTTKFLRQRELKNWKRFDTYIRHQNSIWMVTFNTTNWKTSSCTCPTFFKTYLCKHIVGVALMSKLFAVPPEAKAIPLGQKRKRGRPAKSRKALIVQ